MGENLLLSDMINQCFHRHKASLYMFGEINPPPPPEKQQGEIWWPSAETHNFKKKM